jgi:hypothetical protein
MRGCRSPFRNAGSAAANAGEDASDDARYEVRRILRPQNLVCLRAIITRWSLRDYRFSLISSSSISSAVVMIFDDAE